AEDRIRDFHVTGVQTCALPISLAVRRAAGLVDVSTLGKLDVQGPDAPALLDRLYVNRMDGLAVGRARYGVMLREDGMVFDDGVRSEERRVGKGGRGRWSPRGER